MPQIKPITVSVLTREISRLFEEQIGYVQVVGEISNYKLHSSGHRYFSLKDDNAQISAVMWRTRSLSFEPRDGMKVITGGNVTVYPPQGKYQLDCAFMQPLGLGDLYAAFEELKQKLSQKGYFDSSRKKRIPAIPTKVGIVTSSTGAALQDMISTMRRRNPLCEVLVRPTLVQGDGASNDIVRAIEHLDVLELDCIIIGRGGGSIEDLWAFNTEEVANAIYNCKTPIISAVGHETDFTIADFVVDVRAATPTAAAEIVTPFTQQQFADYIEKLSNDLSKQIRRSLDNRQSLLEQKIRTGVFRRVRERVLNSIQYVDSLESEMRNSVKRNFNLKKGKFESVVAHCTSLHPLSPLQKGFALLQKEGKTLSASDTVNVGDDILIKRSQTSMTAKIETVTNI